MGPGFTTVSAILQKLYSSRFEVECWGYWLGRTTTKPQPAPTVLNSFYLDVMTIFTDDPKTIYIIPIHRASFREEVENYGPTIMKPALAKVIECLLLDVIGFPFGAY